MSASPCSLDRRAFLRQSLAVSLAVGCGFAQVRAEERPFVAASYVVVEKGDLPIIVTAPHGGEMSIPGVEARKGTGMKTGPSGFFAGRDFNTELLAAAIAKEIRARLGRSPYLVMSKVHRKYIDPNRPPEIAVESPRAREVYDFYHAEIAKDCADVRKRFGRGLLLDIHGHGQGADTVFRGTHDGKTDALLVKLLGEQIHSGPKSLAGLLSARGINVQPIDESPEKEGLKGGYTVTKYGAFEGIGAVQLEFGSNFRKKEVIDKVAAKVADGVVDFAKLYLLESAQPPKK